MYTLKEDINEILILMQDIQDGKISRNKNYYTLAKSKEYSRFKRAKLLISLIEDLEKTACVDGSTIEVDNKNDVVEVILFNPNLKYTRKVIITKAELDLILTKTKTIN